MNSGTGFMKDGGGRHAGSSCVASAGEGQQHACQDGGCSGMYVLFEKVVDGDALSTASLTCRVVIHRI